MFHLVLLIGILAVPQRSYFYVVNNGYTTYESCERDAPAIIAGVYSELDTKYGSANVLIAGVCKHVD